MCALVRAQENGSARIQRAAPGIPAGRRAKAAGLSVHQNPLIKKPAAGSQPGGSFRQDAEKDTLEAYAPIFLRAAYAFPPSDSDEWLPTDFLHRPLA